MAEQETQLLSEQVKQQIDEWRAKFPADQQQSAVIQALMIVQEDNGGWLTTPLMDAVADYLSMPKIAVYEVASFYNMYEHKEVGRHKICVCNSISCWLNDSESVLDYLQEKLGIKIGETTPDGKFTLKEVECLAACGRAPVLYIGKDYYENLTPQKLDQLLEELE